MTDETLFSEALAIPDFSARAAYIDRIGDAEQRRRIERLLGAIAQSNPLDRPPADLARTGAYLPGTVTGDASAGIGDRVGPYKLLEKIGEGGMGEVWVADQLEPIKRRVALKLIKPGMDSRSVLGRFEAERQALAVMDHPNIAKVLDAGTTSDGRPYFVMELVKGTPITEFCDARKLTPKQRLELFIPVCHAIQHAHMKGIIHRDIKPSNVLVALHDETPVPKVIDFGVAKAIGQQLTEKTIYTGFGALVGTPAYMAPEQASFNQLDVDTRADVYALGVLLYELLAGSPPIEKERLKLAALDEILRIVRDEEPPRPSTRLSTSQAKASIAATRQSDPAKLSALMRGEIDWIVMKALEKDRTRRYDTANGLAKDIQRYLAGDSVEACPPTLGYRLRKAYRKNRGPVLAVGLMVLVLVAGIAGTTLGLIRARLAQQDAVQAQRAEAERAEGEQQAKKAAEKAANEERAASAVLTLGLRESLRAWPRRLLEETPARPVSVERLLGDIVESMDRTLPWIYEERPGVQAHARRSIAYILHDFELEEAAERQHAAALALYWQASEDVVTDDIISTMDDLADSLNRQGKYAEAEPFYRQVVETYRRTNGEEGFPTRRASIAFAETLVGLGKIAEAERMARRVLEVERRVNGDDADTTLHSMEILARIHASKGEWDEAELLRVRSLEVRRRVNTAESELRLNTTEQLATHFLQRGQPAAAEPLLRESLAMREKQEPESWITFNTQSMLGAALLGQKKYLNAESLLLKGYEGMKAREKTIPPRGRDRLTEAADRLIELYTATNKPDDVKKWWTERAKYVRELAPPPPEKK